MACVVAARLLMLGRRERTQRKSMAQWLWRAGRSKREIVDIAGWAQRDRDAADIYFKTQFDVQLQCCTLRRRCCITCATGARTSPLYGLRSLRGRRPLCLLFIMAEMVLKMCSLCDNKGSDNSNNSCLSVENVTNKEELTSCLKLVPSTISDLGLLKESRIKSNI